MVKVAVYLTGFYLVYSILLSRDKAYGRNRAYILLALTFAMIFPIYTLKTVKPLDIQFFGKFLAEVFITASSDRTDSLYSVFTQESLLQLTFTVYLIGFAVCISKLFTDLLNLLFLILKQKSEGSRIIRFHGFKTAGFSAMGYIFINSKLGPEEAREIIKHEQNHLSNNHFLDIIYVEVIKALQWFNPVIYMFNRSLRAIHEFQADQDCLSSGVPLVNYQSLLLNQVFKSKAFNLTNSFSNPSLIKKRMIMMTKKRSSVLANLKLLIVAPVIGLVFLTISACKENTLIDENQKDAIPVPQLFPSDSRIDTLPPPPPPPPPSSEMKEESDYNTVTEPFVVVEEMPIFPGGDAALLKYIGENTNYPDKAKEQNIQGRVIVRFCITSEGDVNQISILKGADPELDREAIRVVRTLPRFVPGRQGGKAVPVWYMVPITFTLK
jgi:TonB family protein